MFESQKHETDREFPPEVRSALAAYRQAVPDFEGNPDFMPKLWERIEAQQNVSFRFRQLASRLVTASAGLCFALGLILFQPAQYNYYPATGSTYVEVLADEPPEDISPDSAVI